VFEPQCPLLRFFFLLSTEFLFFLTIYHKTQIMTNEETKRAEQIREIVREALNQMLDEEYEAIIKEIKEGKAMLSNRSMTEIVDNLLSSNNANFGEQNSPTFSEPGE